MKHGPLIAAIVMGLAVSGCASMETATRNAPLESPAIKAAPAATAFDVQSVRVSVPETLKVSDANSFYPGGDIVWREDPPGDRRGQVEEIVEAAMLQGVRSLDTGVDTGGVPVMLDVEVTRFHALTEKARYTVGGVHALQFAYRLRDPETGEAYGEPKFVKADFKALGGVRAIAAERKGITQKHRITNHLAEVIRTELADPDGYAELNLGLIGALNQL